MASCFCCVSPVIEGEAEELRLAPLGFHQWYECCLTAQDLIFKLLDGQVVEVRVSVGVVSQIEAAVRPIAQNRSAG